MLEFTSEAAMRYEDLRPYVGEYLIVYDQGTLYTKRLVGLDCPFAQFEDGMMCAVNPGVMGVIFNPLWIRELANDACETNAKLKDPGWAMM